MKKLKFNLPIKVISIVIVIFIAVLFILSSLTKFIRTSDYFKIRDIVINGDDVADLSYLKGQNIFAIDLPKESRYILEQNPNCREIRFVRVFPSRLFIDFIKRRAVGIVKLYRYLGVDGEGVIFEVPGQSENSDLPLILGLETKIFGPKPGKKYTVKELILALDIIREASLNKSLKDYKIKRVDVANMSNASCYIAVPDGKETKVWEIRLGSDSIRDKFDVLAGLINQIKNDVNNIKYIELRFKEPVIKLKDVK